MVNFWYYCTCQKLWDFESKIHERTLWQWILESKSENLVFYQIFVICIYFFIFSIMYKLLVILFVIKLGIPISYQYPGMGQNQTGCFRFPDFWSMPYKQCHNWTTSNDTGPLTKRNKRNTTTSKSIEDIVMQTNYGVRVDFLIFGRFEEIRNLDF